MHPCHAHAGSFVVVTGIRRLAICIFYCFILMMVLPLQQQVIKLMQQWRSVKTASRLCFKSKECSVLLLSVDCFHSIMLRRSLSSVKCTKNDILTNPAQFSCSNEHQMMSDKFHLQLLQYLNSDTNTSLFR